MKYFSNQPVNHPKRNDRDDVVVISNPFIGSPLERWNMKNSHITVVPNGEVPSELNGIKFESWNVPKTIDEWNNVDGQGYFGEPPLQKSNKKTATGTIIKESDGRIWILSPTNGFGGYYVTIGPKGKLETGLNTRANAIKESYEETGLKIELIGFLCDCERTTSLTRYYIAKRVGGNPADMGWETQAVHLVMKDRLKNYLNSEIDRKLVDEIV